MHVRLQHRLLQDLGFVSVSFGLTKTHDNRCFGIEAKQPKQRFVSDTADTSFGFSCFESKLSFEGHPSLCGTKNGG